MKLTKRQLTFKWVEWVENTVHLPSKEDTALLLRYKPRKQPNTKVYQNQFLSIILCRIYTNKIAIYGLDLDKFSQYVLNSPIELGI